MKFFLRPAAETDLEELWNFIAKDSVNRADRFVEMIFNQFEKITINPHIGRIRRELQAGIRSFPFQNHVIYYQVLSERIEIIRVLHDAQNRDIIMQTEIN
ncbi:MAG: type II toxin-antitoxin system RelE/ParE family toxin [bacterium]|nr:type II toxin-antitoxin system RelE/ParE family toxin [bacterium]